MTCHLGARSDSSVIPGAVALPFPVVSLVRPSHPETLYVRVFHPSRALASARARYAPCADIVRPSLFLSLPLSLSVAPSLPPWYSSTLVDLVFLFTVHLLGEPHRLPAPPLFRPHVALRRCRRAFPRRFLFFTLSSLFCPFSFSSLLPYLLYFTRAYFLRRAYRATQRITFMGSPEIKRSPLSTREESFAAEVG